MAIYTREPIEESDMNLQEKLKNESVDFRNDQESVPIVAAEREKAQEISAAEKDNKYEKILAKVQTPIEDSPDHASVTGDAEAVAKKTDAESQIQHLVDIAQQKGVVHAVKVAQHMENNYILDNFHDRLMSDDLHDALIAKGMIK